MSANASYVIDRKPVEDRKKECQKLLEKYPDKVPILVSKLKNSNAEQINKEKYLVPGDMTLGQFMCVIRRRLKYPPERALFLFVDGNIPSGTQYINEIYHQYKSPEDGFLRFAYAEENVFG